MLIILIPFALYLLFWFVVLSIFVVTLNKPKRKTIYLNEDEIADLNFLLGSCNNQIEINYLNKKFKLRRRQNGNKRTNRKGNK